MKLIKKSTSLKKIKLLFPVVTAIIAAALSFTNLLQKAEYKVYDILLGMQKEIPAYDKIKLIEVDDESISKIGVWPWPRDILGEVLIRMKECGAKTAVFDIEYLEKTQKSVNIDFDSYVDSCFQDSITDIENYFGQFNQYIYSLDSVTQNSVEDASNELLGAIAGDTFFTLKDNIQSAYEDKDLFFAKSIQFFGNTFVTVNLRNIKISEAEENLNYAANRFLLDNVSDSFNYIPQGNYLSFMEENDFENYTPEQIKNRTVPLQDFMLPINKIVIRAAGLGFTNVVVDKDGTRRRVELLNVPARTVYNEESDSVETEPIFNGKYVAQLSFSPLLKMMDVESIERKKHTLILKNAHLPGKSKPVNIKIPLDKNGRMYINWIHESYEETFSHVPVFYIYNLSVLEKNIFQELQNLSHENSAGDFLHAYNLILDQRNSLLQKCRGFDENSNAIKGGISEEDTQEYFALRADFFKSLTDFINENPDEKFSELKNNLQSYNSLFENLKSILNDSFCLLGQTSTSSTDLGVTPFEKRYANLGTHANVVNTIIQQKFIREESVFWGIGFGALLSLAVIFILRKKSYAFQIAFSLVYVAATIFVITGLMVYLRIYIQPLIPILMILAIYFEDLVYNLVSINNQRKKSEAENKRLEQQKNEIQGAFNKSLAPSVVDMIMKDPSIMTPGGTDFDMTAIFTDIQKFSGFSEFLTSNELVQLLNYYLDKMAEVIIDEGGLVDKYEGDAIVALVGAPVKMEDHASRACAAAIRMKALEIELNREIYGIVECDEQESYRRTMEISSAGGRTPREKDVLALLSSFKKMVEHKRKIFTRIGINSGIMTAGFMGSENKLNYTMMGNNVNLASRLEGVNKVFGTGGILISGHTAEKLNGGFILRILHKVRVVNVNTPLRVYELLETQSAGSEELKLYIEDWNKAHELFENKDWSSALDKMKSLSMRNPEDNVVKYYINLLENYFVKGKIPLEKDNVGVEYQEQDNVFRLCQK
ncbi:MAG: adenylate/guanylate cyclase domain-containing protein [Spirochaetia bacterium]|nr:adenylate/guanylate cyclase domain-containing protein [Spirochaetia bacterium]